MLAIQTSALAMPSPLPATSTASAQSSDATEFCTVRGGVVESATNPFSVTRPLTVPLAGAAVGWYATPFMPSEATVPPLESTMRPCAVSAPAVLSLEQPANGAIATSTQRTADGGEITPTKKAS